jgi:hypothetical protein
MDMTTKKALKKKSKEYRCIAPAIGHDHKRCRGTTKTKGGLCENHLAVVAEPSQPGWAKKAITEPGQYIDVRSDSRPEIVHHVYTGDSVQAPHCTCEAFHHGTREYNVLFRLSGLFRTEWTEKPSAWPHCCTQARCWMHVNNPWCDCHCWWCRIARLLRKESIDTEEEPPCMSHVQTEATVDEGYDSLTDVQKAFYDGYDEGYKAKVETLTRALETIECQHDHQRSCIFDPVCDLDCVRCEALRQTDSPLGDEAHRAAIEAAKGDTS